MLNSKLTPYSFYMYTHGLFALIVSDLTKIRKGAITHQAEKVEKGRGGEVRGGKRRGGEGGRERSQER